MLYKDFESMVFERPGTTIRIVFPGGIAKTEMSLFEFRRDWLKSVDGAFKINFDVVDPENKIVEIRALWNPNTGYFDGRCYNRWEKLNEDYTCEDP